MATVNSEILWHVLSLSEGFPVSFNGGANPAMTSLSLGVRKTKLLLQIIQKDHRSLVFDTVFLSEISGFFLC